MSDDARGEFQRLFEALLRASGLPATEVAGRVMRRRPTGAAWTVSSGRISAWKTGRDLPAVGRLSAFLFTVRVMTELARGRIARGHFVGELLDEVSWESLLNRARATSVVKTIRNVREENLEVNSDIVRSGERHVPQIPSLSDMKALLLRRIHGQDVAVDEISSRLIHGSFRVSGAPEGVDAGRRPRGVFLFAGPPGSGKRQAVGAVAEVTFGVNELCRFAMAEFSSARAMDQLFGVPPGCGDSCHGILADWIESHPSSVVLFEGIEYATPAFLDRMLILLEDGQLIDGLGRINSFHQSIIVFTMDVDSVEISSGSRLHERAVSYAELKEHCTDAVQRHFCNAGRFEIVNRIGDNVIAFDLLRSSEAVSKIVERQLGRTVNAVSERGYGLEFDRPAVTDFISRSIDRNSSGRTVVNWMEKFLVIPLVSWLTEAKPPVGSIVSVRLAAEPINFTFRVEELE